MDKFVKVIFFWRQPGARQKDPIRAWASLGSGKYRRGILPQSANACPTCPAIPFIPPCRAMFHRKRSDGRYRQDNGRRAQGASQRTRCRHALASQCMSLSRNRCIQVCPAGWKTLTGVHWQTYAPHMRKNRQSMAVFSLVASNPAYSSSGYLCLSLSSSGRRLNHSSGIALR